LDFRFRLIFFAFLLTILRLLILDLRIPFPMRDVVESAAMPV